MYYEGFKYPSEWTESWNHYVANRQELCNKITQMMTNYDKQLPQLQKQTQDLTDYFFSANELLKHIQ